MNPKDVSPNTRLLSEVRKTLQVYREEFWKCPMKRKLLIETSGKMPLEIAQQILRFAK